MLIAIFLLSQSINGCLLFCYLPQPDFTTVCPSVVSFSRYQFGESLLALYSTRDTPEASTSQQDVWYVPVPVCCILYGKPQGFLRVHCFYSLQEVSRLSTQIYPSGTYEYLHLSIETLFHFHFPFSCEHASMRCLHCSRYRYATSYSKSSYLLY